MLKYIKAFLISLIIGYCMILPGHMHAQLMVVQGAAMNLTPQQLVQNYLVGAGITVSNVTFNGTSTTITSDQVGKFATAGVAASQLGLAGGILMTTGKASIAIGPNNLPGAGFQVSGPGDPDLNILAGSNTFDKAVIEFDFIPQNDTVRFRYVFGSEEFFEYCNQYNDAFGFFLSGPGINGTFSNNSVNIARMPNSINNYVTINNICANTQSRWNNAGGQYYQYDGLTYVYTAWYVVQPCTTYHIKLAIGDAVDKAFDSGVFLEQNSFSSPGVNMVNNNTIPQLGNKAVEGCNDVAINFRLMANLNYPYTVHYTIGGTAVNGVDYTQINDYVTFPPNVDSVNVIIHPIQDNIPEGVQSVIITLNQISCDGIIKADTVYIDDYIPMTIEPNADTSLCFGGSIELKANTTGGIMPLTYQWNIPGTDSTVIIIPPVGSNVYTVKVTDVCTHYVYDTAAVLVHPVPVANAGINIVIANGTSTTLHGTASGGYGNYGYAWTSNPPGFNSTLPEPSTGNMSNTIIYILRVTDLASGCVSLPSQVIVTVEGGPLSINPVSEPNAVCLGDTAQLYALSGGGSGLYTYSWSSTPAGFTSSTANPLVAPTVSTNYSLTVNDGFNQLTGATNVVVYPLPEIYLGPADSTVCIYDTVRLDAGNPGSTYLWSTGSKSRYLTTSTTGIGFDVQSYHVVVTNQNGCKNKASIKITFSFNDCVGIEEHSRNLNFSIYPNPAHGSFRLIIRNPGNAVSIELINMVGSKMLTGSLNRSDHPAMEKEFDVSSLPRGVYILRVRGQKFTGAVKLVLR
ncbi:MAG: choice-of-anchor L domain-containing protein [Bacteroidales bacterium]|nr:choice-of-anchor L domain-containing protein [Bacteroidales bacterium]